MKHLIWLVCLLIPVLFGCKAKKNSDVTDTSNADSALVADSNVCIVPKYAKGFQVTYTDKGYCLLDIKDPQKEEGGESYHFLLKPEGVDLAEIPEGYTVIKTPVKSTICMTSLQLSNFIKLDELDAVVGITSTRHLFNADMQKRLDEGKTHKIGIEGNFDNEIIMGINPDVILISPFKRGGYDALTEVGIPLIPHLGYKEMTPLGQAEWIKFIGLLIGKEEKANRIFAEIESRYLELVKLTSEVKKRPVVFSGELRGGNWYAVGGKSFLAQLFMDAGADYFLKDDVRSGGVSLDFETVCLCGLLENRQQLQRGVYLRCLASRGCAVCRFSGFQEKTGGLLQHESETVLRKYAGRTGSSSGRPDCGFPSSVAAQPYSTLL